MSTFVVNIPDGENGPDAGDLLKILAAGIFAEDVSTHTMGYYRQPVDAVQHHRLGITVMQVA